MVDKIINNLKWALWALWNLNTKDILQNIAGVSPFQLIFGYNSDLPTTTPENLSALSMKTSSKTSQENLDAIHKSRSVFIASENDVRIKRIFLQIVRTFKETMSPVILLYIGEMIPMNSVDQA